MSRNKYTSVPMYGTAMSKREEERAAARRGAYVSAPQITPAPSVPVQPEQPPQEVIPNQSESGYAFKPEPAYLQQAAFEQQEQYNPAFQQPVTQGNPSRTPPPAVQRSSYTGTAHKHEWLQMIMTFFLPALFVLCFVLLLILKRDNAWLFGILFIAAAGVCVLLMHTLNAFKPSSRSTLTAVCLACSTVMAVAMLFNVMNSPSCTGQTTTVSTQAQNTGSGEQRNRNYSVEQPIITAAPQQIVDTSVTLSAAEQRLQEFVGYWGKQQTEKCLELCHPDWVANQDDPKRSLYSLISDVTPIQIVQVEKIDGAETDSNRTVTVLLRVSDYFKNETFKRYSILMLKVNKVWYIDPASLSGAITVDVGEVADKKLTVTPAPTVTATPKATTSPDKTLYYNPDGGTFYHVSKDCSSMNAASQRKLKPFTYQELNNPPYDQLKRCPKCGAPARPE